MPLQTPANSCEPLPATAGGYLNLIEELTPSLVIRHDGAGFAGLSGRSAAWKIERTNMRAQQLFGVLDPAEFNGEALERIIGGDDLLRMNSVLSLTDAGLHQPNIIVTARTFQGDPLPVTVGACSVAPGSIRLVFAALEGAREAGALLQASEERYRQLFHAMPIALLRVDARGSLAAFEEPRRLGVTDLEEYLKLHPSALEHALDTVCIAEANEHAEKLFGNGEPKSMLRPVRVYWEARPDTFRRIMAARYSGQMNLIEETLVCGVAGQRVPVLFSMAYPPETARAGNSLIGMIDISAQVHAEAELQRVQARFADAARISLTNELAASIAHEVSQPLSSISTNGGTALRWLAKSPPDVERAVNRMERIISDAERAIGVIGRLRDMSSGIAVEHTTLDLNAVVQEGLMIAQDNFCAKVVDVRLRLGSDLPMILGDHVQLTQVAVNLLVNAMQAMDRSSRTSASIEIVTRLDDEGWVALEVHDNGPGIGAEDLNRIFDSFFTTKSSGFGMGLAICRSIVEAHCGQLTAKSGLAGGAVFTARLPVDAEPVEEGTASQDMRRIRLA